MCSCISIFALSFGYPRCLLSFEPAFKPIAPVLVPEQPNLPSSTPGVAIAFKTIGRKAQCALLSGLDWRPYDLGLQRLLSRSRCPSRGAIWLNSGFGKGEGVLVASYLRNTDSDPLGDFFPFSASFKHFEGVYERAPKWAGCCARRQSSIFRSSEARLEFTCLNGPGTPYLMFYDLYGSLHALNVLPRAANLV